MFAEQPLPAWRDAFQIDLHSLFVFEVKILFLLIHFSLVEIESLFFSPAFLVRPFVAIRLFEHHFLPLVRRAFGLFHTRECCAG
jgi:hypothetical protein